MKRRKAGAEDLLNRAMGRCKLAILAMIQIDGSQGEGGGQVLRTSLALSLITGKPMTITNIRSGRPKPGLMPQHLKAVESATAVGQASVEGAYPGSRSLVFKPKEIRSGEFHFDIGTAGSTLLVAQNISLPLSFAPTASSVVITGGTHVPWSPCFHYLDLHWLPLMRKIGFDIRLELNLAGFYPKGGGRIQASIQPAASLSPLQLTERGALQRIRGISAVANLELGVAERQKNQTLSRLRDHSWEADIEVLLMPSRFKGSMLLLRAEFEHSECCYVGLGARGKPAEQVADEAVDGLEEFLATDGVIDPYLADQLILPLALASGVSELRTSKVTSHLLTNADIIQMFLPVEIQIIGDLSHTGLIQITP